MRHAAAANGQPDILRPLTSEGRTQCASLVRTLRPYLADGPCTILVSPAVRSAQTVSLEYPSAYRCRRFVVPSLYAGVGENQPPPEQLEEAIANIWSAISFGADTVVVGSHGNVLPGLLTRLLTSPLLATTHGGSVVNASFSYPSTTTAVMQSEKAAAAVLTGPSWPLGASVVVRVPATRRRVPGRLCAALTPTPCLSSGARDPCPSEAMDAFRELAVEHPLCV